MIIARGDLNVKRIALSKISAQFFQQISDIRIYTDRPVFDFRGANRLAVVYTRIDCIRVLRGKPPERIFYYPGRIIPHSKLLKQNIVIFIAADKILIPCRRIHPHPWERRKFLSRIFVNRVWGVSPNEGRRSAALELSPFTILGRVLGG